MKNFINKNVIVLLIAFAFIFSFSSVSAQQVCVTANGGPGQISAGACIPLGSNTPQGATPQGQGGNLVCPAGTVRVNVNGQIACQPTGTGGVQGGSTYTQGQYQKTNGSKSNRPIIFQKSYRRSRRISNYASTDSSWCCCSCVFFFYLIKYLIAGKNDPAEKKKSINFNDLCFGSNIYNGLLWGIVAFFGDFIGINPNVQVNAPALPIR